MKNGFTMIELIFTIVILAITTMAIPRMVAQTAELNVFAIKQELVMNAKTVLTQIAKVPWDSAYKYVVCTTDPAATPAARTANANTCTNVVNIHRIPGGNAILNQRAGIIDSVDKRSISNVDAAAPVGGVSFGSGNRNDVDDYNGYNQSMAPVVDVTGANTSGDFLLTTDIAVTVGFVSDAVLAAGQNYATSQELNATLNTTTVAGPTNIKMIQISASDRSDPTRNVVLRTYSFNIGASNIRFTAR